MLQIFMRDPVTRAMVPCTEIKDVPRDVATICSDYIYKKIVSQGEPYLVLDNSLGLAPYKFVFDWIKTCGQEQNVASAPEVSLTLHHTPQLRILTVMYRSRTSSTMRLA